MLHNVGIERDGKVDAKRQECLASIAEEPRVPALLITYNLLTIYSVRYDRLEGLSLTEKQNRCCERLNVHTPFRVNVVVSED